MLKALAGMGTAVLPFRARSLANDSPAAPGQMDLQWGYEGVTGPEHWSELSPDYSLCQFGIRQSPVDLVDAIKHSRSGAIRLDYRPVTAKAVSDPVGLKIVLDPGCQIELYERTYVLTEFRFRRPSEHLLSGRALEMEMQFLHVAENGDQALMAVFLRQGQGTENAGLAAILANAAADTPADQAAQVFPLHPFDLMPQFREDENQRAFYVYSGSLTMPPCTERVQWAVFKTPSEASPQQIRDLASLFSRNARPAQKMNGRLLLEFDGKSASLAP